MRVYVKGLRRKLGDDAGSAKFIRAELRVGCRMPEEKKPKPNS